jgi:putative ABC transport system permease protein
MHDLKFALRQLWKYPGFSVVAMLTLAIGIGACTAIFSVVNAVLLRPLNYPDADRLVVIRETNLPQFPEFSVAPANYLDWQKQSDVFANIYATRSGSFNLTGDGDPIRVIAGRVTASYFDTLGVKPLLGRTFKPEEETIGNNKVVVLSYGFWQRHFGGRPTAVNELLTLDGDSYTVIGVMPEGFNRGALAEIFAPINLSDTEWQVRGGHWISVGARLKPGVTLAKARTQMETIADRLAAQYPDTNKGWSTKIMPQLEYATRGISMSLYCLLGAVGALLLIACANVANLLLARAITRHREISIRAALGASRWQITRQLLTESLVLAVGGGVLGFIFAHFGLAALLSLAPADLPRIREIGIDGWTLTFTSLLVLLTGFGFGLVPARQTANLDLVGVLKEGGRGVSVGARHLGRHALVVAEIALSLILLAGAGLFIRSLTRLQSVSPGFDPQNAVMVSFSIPRSKYPDAVKQAAFADAVLKRFAALPGVTSVGATHILPFSGNDYITAFAIEGRPPVKPSERPSSNFYAVTPDYFKAMGIPLLRGRTFTDDDRAEAARVAIISKSLADQYFPNQDPIGKRINIDDREGAWDEIIGVVGEVKNYGLDRDNLVQSYEPFAQNPFGMMTFVVRTSGPQAGLANALRREVYAVDRNQPVFRIESLETLIMSSYARQRFATTLFTVFSSLALALAAIGIYGVMSYTVSQRTGEFGIRIALGAQRRDLLRLVLGQGVRLTALGIIAGLVGALAAGRVVQSILFQTGASDPLTFAIIAVLLLVVALIACLLPALRATTVDPVEALRME